MLFTTTIFTFLYLPAVIIGFFLFARLSRTLAACWLFAASVFFYGYWMPRFTLLLLGSIAVNFLVGRQIGACGRDDTSGRRLARRWMIAGVA
ncbi:MAG: MBOAT family protein, partial [Steroidobacteraceae bacterium]